MRLSKTHLLAILLLASLLANFFFFYIEDEKYIEMYESQIQELETKVNSLQLKNTGLQTQVVELEKESDALDIQIEVIKQERIDIIQSYEYYLKDILELDDTELERWFITRYKPDPTVK